VEKEIRPAREEKCIDRDKQGGHKKEDVGEKSEGRAHRTTKVVPQKLSTPVEGGGVKNSPKSEIRALRGRRGENKPNLTATIERFSLGRLVEKPAPKKQAWHRAERPGRHAVHQIKGKRKWGPSFQINPHTTRR